MADKVYDTNQMSQILNRMKAHTESVVHQKEKRFIVLFVFAVFGFAICFIIFWANFASREKSFREEIEMLEQKVVSLELSLEKTNGKIEGTLKEINETLSEISANVLLASETVKGTDGELLLPQLDTSFKSYMDYRAITCTASEQYALQQQAYTDDLGLREIDGFYCIALGTYYSSQCGEKFKILTDNGNEFYVIVADIKDDRHTDDSNMYVPLSNGNANVVEFIVDTPAMERRVALLGDISGYEQFSGNIVKIERA